MTLIGKIVPVPTATRPGKWWWVTLETLCYHTENDAIFEITPRRYFKSRPRVALSTFRFEEEDPLVATIRRARFLAKLNQPKL